MNIFSSIPYVCHSTMTVSVPHLKKSGGLEVKNPLNQFEAPRMLFGREQKRCGAKSGV